MGLTRAVEFKTSIQRRNRIQVPRAIRWEFKMESTQVLFIRVNFDGSWHTYQEFYGHMAKDGRVAIPKLTSSLLRKSYGEQAIYGAAVVVRVAPPSVEDEE